MIKLVALDRIIQVTLRSADGNLLHEALLNISEPQRLAIIQRWESSVALDTWHHQEPVKVYEAFLADSREAPADSLLLPAKDIGRYHRHAYG